MKNLYDIVDFYELIKTENLFPRGVFSDESLDKIGKQIHGKNNEFISLVEQDSSKNDFGYKSLEIILNKLTNIYWQINSDLSTHIGI